MNEIQKTAMQRALPLLNAAGAKYIIISSDGEHLSNDETMVLAAKEEKKERTRSIKYPHGFFKAMYKDPLSKLNLSDGWSFDMDTTELANDLRAAASAYCSKLYGNGSCMSSVVGKQVQILRIY